MNNRVKGKLGELIAANFLSKKGIKIIERNYLNKLGEIDLIGIENETIIFIEVKLRYSNRYGKPFEAVDKKKLDRIRNCGLFYILNLKKKNIKIRIDVVSIEFYLNDLYRIEWIKNYY